MRQSIISQFTKSAFVLAAMCAANPAWAFISGEVTVGQRSGAFKETGTSGKTLTSQTVEIAGHLDPIPLIPIGFGVRMVSDSYDAKVADHGYKSMTSTAIVPEVTAWLSILGDIVPFARVGYTAMSAYKATAEQQVAGNTVSGSVVLKSTGPRMAAGVHYSLLPLISITGAVEHSTETVSISEGKVGGIDLTQGAKDISYSNTAFLLGVKAGL